MSLSFYKFVHLVGVFMILMPLGAIAFHVLLGGTRTHIAKRSIAIFHGMGMLLSLVAGFGLKAKLEIEGWPSWLLAKLVVWLLLGAMIGIAYRVSNKSRLAWWLTIALAATAAYLGIFKP